LSPGKAPAPPAPALVLAPPAQPLPPPPPPPSPPPPAVAEESQSLSGAFSTSQPEATAVNADTYETRNRKCLKNNSVKNKPDLISDYDKNIQIIRENKNNIFNMLKEKKLIDNNISTDDFLSEYIENNNNFTVSALCSILEYISSPKPRQEATQVTTGSLQESTQVTTGSLQESTQVTTGSPSSRTRSATAAAAAV
jgi:hypothetical protein